MLKVFLFLALVSGSSAAAALPRVDCNGCSSLREFGNYGAASLYRATGPAGPAVGSDRVWVDNPGTGASVFVDVDTPIVQHTVMGTEIPIPDLTHMEINATWADGSGTGTWILPNAVLAAMGESIEAAERNGTPEVTPEEVKEIPGLSGKTPWRTSGWSGGHWGFGRLQSGGWVFRVHGTGRALPIVTIVECVWENVC